MSESDADRARSAEAVRFARREACRDVVEELEAALAACRAERDGERAEIVTLLDHNEHLAAERDAALADAAAARGALWRVVDALGGPKVPAYCGVPTCGKQIEAAWRVALDAFYALDAAGRAPGEAP